MGYGFYEVGYERRPAGYMVIATCDKRGCGTIIDRGLGYLCGEHPGNPRWDAGPGCHRYYCDKHLSGLGSRGGCDHPRSARAWGRTLSDMVPNADGSIVCLDPIGHEGDHAWTREGGVP